MDWRGRRGMVRREAGDAAASASGRAQPRDRCGAGEWITTVSAAKVRLG